MARTRTSPRSNSNSYSNAVKYGRGGGNRNFSNRQKSGQPLGGSMSSNSDPRPSGQPKGGSMSSNSGGSHGSTDTRNNRRDREQGSSSHQQSGQPQGGSMSSNSDPRPSTSTSGGSQSSIDTRNKPDENVSNIFYWLGPLFL